jgi:hypothetical protein
MCAIYAFSLLLSGFGLHILITGEATMPRKLSGSVRLRGTGATILGLIWTAIGASTLLVAVFSGTAVRVAAMLPDEVRFLVGVVRGVSQCTVIAGILVFMLTLLVILFLPSGDGDGEDGADTG